MGTINFNKTPANLTFEYSWIHQVVSMHGHGISTGAASSDQIHHRTLPEPLPGIAAAPGLLHHMQMSAYQ